MQHRSDKISGSDFPLMFYCSSGKNKNLPALAVGSVNTLTDEAGKRLDGGYAAFGKVTEGSEVVEQITALPTEKVDIGIPGVDVNEPIEPEYMEKVIVETWGVEYDEPVILG